MRKNIILGMLLFIAVISVNAQTQLTNLPTVYITTDDGLDPASKEIYQTGKVTIKSPVASEELTDVKTDVRGRGNSTWNFAKKPYRLKLDKKASLLGMPAKAKKWCLLANHVDKTLIRNAVAFKISEMLGFEFTPAYRFVDLVLNGRYAGNYLLTDQVEVSSNRVPVEEDGGFLLEVDFRYEQEPVKFVTTKGIGVVVKYPDEDADGNDIDPADPRVSYIREFTQQFEDVLFSTDFKNPTTGYRAWVDEKSLVNWYITMELVGDQDAWQTGYLYKYKDVDKLYFGPLWDFDISFNNNNISNAANKLMREAVSYNTWVKRLWEDEWFRKAVNNRWKQLIDDQNLVAVLTDFIHATTQEIDQSQQRNFQTWPVLTTKIFYEQYLFPTYAQGVDFLVDYIENRAAFLTNAFYYTDPSVMVYGKVVNTGPMTSTIPLYLKAKVSDYTVFNNSGTLNVNGLEVGAGTLLYNSGTVNVTGQ